MQLWRLAKTTLVISLVIAAGWWIWQSRRQPGGPSAVLGTVGKGNLVVKVTISGTVMPRRYALIAAPYNGYVQKMYVKIGDRVSAGAPVVSVAQSVGGGQDEVFPLLSPLTGIVAQVWKREGEYVAAGTTGGNGESGLVRIDDTSKLTVESNVPEVEIGKLNVGLPVVIRAVAVPERTYSGRIAEIALAARELPGSDKSRVEFPLSITISDQDEKLHPGMSVAVDIIVNESKDVLLLPHEFVQKGSSGYFVTTAAGERHKIEVGLTNEDAFEIKSGVTLGEKVRQIDFLAIGGEP